MLTGIVRAGRNCTTSSQPCYRREEGLKGLPPDAERETVTLM